MNYFDAEDLAFIKTYATLHSLDPYNDSHPLKWDRLAARVGSDVEKVREAVRQLKSQETQVEVVHTEDFSIDENSSYIDSAFFRQVLVDQNLRPNQSLSVEINFENVLQNLPTIGGEMVPLETINEYEVAALPEGPPRGVRRQRELEDEDEPVSRLVTMYTKHSKEELELKRKEHQMKLEILNQKLLQGKEIFDEQMKFLKAKREHIERKIYSIDLVAGSRNQLKRSKSTNF